jgi:hypothetical protein
VFQRLKLRLRRSLNILLLKQRRIGGVMERTQHSGNILQRGAFFPPLCQGARGFAFEINDHEVTPGE